MNKEKIIQALNLLIAAFNEDDLQTTVITTEEKVPRETSAETQDFNKLDADGIPWDARIHAKNKGTVANGTWRKARGVSDELYTKVVAELKGLVENNKLHQESLFEDETTTTTTQTPATQAPAPAPATQAPAPAPATQAPAPATQAPAPATQAPATQAPAPATQVVQYPNLCAWVNWQVQAGYLTTEQVNNACLQVGQPTLNHLAIQPELSHQVARLLGMAH